MKKLKPTEIVQSAKSQYDIFVAQYGMVGAIAVAKVLYEKLVAKHNYLEKKYGNLE
jgi:hypothetical protein